MQPIPVSQALDLAIAAEKAAERFYLCLSEVFSGAPDLAQFWLAYAQDETKHAEWLEGLKARLSPTELDQLVDDPVLKMLEAVANFSVEKALASIRDLEDAYQLVNDLESGETNAIFQFMLNNFEADEQMRTFLRLQLDRHVGRLSIDLPLQYRGIAARKAIRAARG
jgi:rubrerythrin